MYTRERSSLYFVNCIWHAVVERDEVYTDSANEYWAMGFIRRTDDSLLAELYGPSLRPRVLEGRAGEEYWGIEFKANVTLAAVSKGDILNTRALLPVNAADNSLSIGGRHYSMPRYDQLERFAQQLEKDGVIAIDQRISRALEGRGVGLSERSRQRHFKNTTGLTKKQIEQLQRARHAYYLLQTGSSLPQAAAAAGYSDQPHMTRSLKLLHGETPAQIIAAHLGKS